MKVFVRRVLDDKHGMVWCARLDYEGSPEFKDPSWSEATRKLIRETENLAEVLARDPERSDEGHPMFNLQIEGLMPWEMPNFGENNNEISWQII